MSGINALIKETTGKKKKRERPQRDSLSLSPREVIVKDGYGGRGYVELDTK